MADKTNKVQLKVSAPTGFNVNITLGDKTYHVQTEHSGKKHPELTTRIYHKGEIIYSKKTDYASIIKGEDFDKKIVELINQHHKLATDEFVKKYEENRKKIQYFDTVKKLLITKNHKQALKILQDALAEAPEDPFVLSYYGYLRAVVDKKYAEGIKICQRALKKLGTPVTPEEKSLYASFYLNLGRAYLAGGEKKSSIDAFINGLKFDKSDHDLLWELRKLGVRKGPPIPFLSRNNPLNKFLGKLRAKIKGK